MPFVMNGVVNNVTHGVNASSPAREDPAPLSAAEDIKPSVELAPPVPPNMQHVAVPDDFVIYTCKIGKGKLLKIPLPKEFSKERLYRFLLTQVDDDDDRGTP